MRGASFSATQIPCRTIRGYGHSAEFEVSKSNTLAVINIPTLPRSLPAPLLPAPLSGLPPAIRHSHLGCPPTLNPPSRTGKAGTARRACWREIYFIRRPALRRAASHGIPAFADHHHQRPSPGRLLRLPTLGQPRPLRCRRRGRGGAAGLRGGGLRAPMAGTAQDEGPLPLPRPLSLARTHAYARGARRHTRTHAHTHTHTHKPIARARAPRIRARRAHTHTNARTHTRTHTQTDSARASARTACDRARSARAQIHTHTLTHSRQGPRSRPRQILAASL